jgi:hypothetical protein
MAWSASALMLWVGGARSAGAQCSLECHDGSALIPLGRCEVKVDYFDPVPGTNQPLVETDCHQQLLCDPPSDWEFGPGAHQVTCRLPDVDLCTFTVVVDAADATIGFCSMPNLQVETAGLGLLELDGSVVAMGGERPNGATAEVAVIVDQNQQSVHELLRALPTPTFNFAFARCEDQAALIGGSGGDDDVLEFEDLDQSFGVLPPTLHSNLLRARSVNAAAVCVPGRSYFAMGGQASDGSASVGFIELPFGDDDPDSVRSNPGRAHGTRAILDPIQLADMLVPAHGNEAIFDDGPAGPRILVFGGFNEANGILDTVQEYDLETGQWSLLPDMPTPRFAPAVTIGPDGKVYVTGGFGDDFLDSTDIATLTPDLSWSPGPKLAVPRSFAAAAATNDGIYVAGGFSSFRPTHALEFLPIAGYACVNTAEALCVESREFQIDVTFRVSGGEPQRAHPVALNGSSGYFWFFEESNIELAVKVLDARSVNGHHWVFAAGLTNLEVDIEVTHLPTGATKHYFNPQGQAFTTINDTAAFLDPAPSSSPLQAVSAASDASALDSEPSDTAARERSALESRAGGPLFLSGERYRVDVAFETPDGAQSVGDPDRLTPDSGTFSFFDPNNLEIVAKVLDACAVNGRTWVFLAGLTDLAVTITVTDTQSGSVRTYQNPPGMVFRSVLDIDAFPAC